MPFEDPASWHHFDVQTIWPQARGYHSAVATDGYTWFVPYVRENRDFHGFLVRYRHGFSFDDPKAWDSLDLMSINPRGRGFVGGCTDGEYLYLGPYHEPEERHGQAVRYKLSAPFSDMSSWEFFDTEQLDTESRGYFGAIAHGDYIYYLPHCKLEGVYHGMIARFERIKVFSDPSAWSFCDTAEYHPLSKGYLGAVIVDGNMYLSPYETEPFAHVGIAAKLTLSSPLLWRSGNKVNSR
jgi:hypothetical protein